MCVYFSREQTSVDSLLSRGRKKKNRKTVCFLLFSQLLFTHFRYSINLIGKSFIIERRVFVVLSLRKIFETLVIMLKTMIKRREAFSLL
jgi:hypothetical protein